MIKIEVNCHYCGRPFSFFWDDMTRLIEKDIKHKQPEIRYIECPMCCHWVFIAYDKEGWKYGIKKADGTYLWRKQDNELSRT